MDYQLVLKMQCTPADLMLVMHSHIENHNSLLGFFAVSSDSVMFSGQFIYNCHVITCLMSLNTSAYYCSRTTCSVVQHAQLDILSPHCLCY